MDKGDAFLSDLVLFRTYAKIKDNGFKETWEEVIDRVLNHHCEKFPQFVDYIIDTCREPLLKKQIVPSMRWLQFAGEGIKREPLRGFNCSSIAITEFRAFAEIFYVLSCGAGIGFSVQKHHVKKLPKIKEGVPGEIFVISDSKEGWSDSIKLLLENQQLNFDYSLIRPEGSPLSTGGSASGPAALINLHDSIRQILLSAIGRKLTSIECHDIACIIADAVVVGGVRRCLPKDSLVHTSTGLIQIQHVKPGMKVQTTKGMYPVMNVFEQGTQKTLKIKTDAGDLECTPKHKVAVINGYKQYTWKQAGELTVDDRLVFTNKPLISGKSELPCESYNKSKRATTLKDIIIPELSPNMTWLVGYIQGNGYVDIHEDGDGKFHGMISVSVPSNATDRKNKVEEALKEFGTNVRTIDGCGKVWNVRCHSMKLASYFLENVKKPKSEMSVPSFILQGNFEQRAAYLCGLFDADGAANDRPLSLSSVYPEFLSSVQKLAASLAIPSYIKTARLASDNWKCLYKINFKSAGRINLTRIMDIYGTKTIPVSDKMSGQRAYSYPSPMIPEKKYPKSLNVSVEAIGIEDQPFIPVKILDIVEGREIQTYDIEVDEVHEFYTNGFLVHNSATISLFDADDKLMLASKQDEWWVDHPYRARANNSAVLLRTDKNFEKKTKKVIKACYNSNAGEPGFFMTNDKEMLTNPCMPSSTPILTPYGIRTLGEVGKGSKIWDGEKWVKIKRKWSTGNKDVYKYITKHGNFLGTENHVILNGGQRMEVGSAGGIDICVGQKPENFKYGEEEFKRGSNFKRDSETVPQSMLYGNTLEMISFLAGVFDSIVTTYIEFKHRIVAEQLQLMLSAIGVVSEIEECDQSYHLSISQEIDTTIQSVQYVSNEEVFDITVDSEEHVFWSGGHLVSNCSEISLLSRGVCNLTEVNWGVVQWLPWEDKNRAFLAATILGTIQASYTDFHYISPEWKKNAEEEALLGVSITGQAENRRSLDVYLGTGIVDKMIEKNKQVAKMIGIRPSKRITTTKPSGSASAFLAATSGIHSAHSDYYIRRVRIDKSNPITKHLLTIPEFADFIEDDIFIKSNSIISIPICKKGTATRNDETCLTLFREMLNIQEKWITPGHVDGPNHHNVSLTLSYKPEEKEDLAKMILEHSGEFNGVSLLPYDGSVYQQTPFEEITEERYNELIAKFPSVDLSKVSFKLYADDTGTENACAGGVCEFGV